MSGEMIYPPVEELVPHRGAMLLLDRVHEASADHLRAEARVRRDSWYADGDGNMPSWIGIELMAQAIAAYAGWTHRLRGEPVKTGFLLGSRKYSCTVAAFPCDAVVEITINLMYREPNGLGAFSCAIAWRGETVAQAVVTVFEPENQERYLRAANP